MKKTPTKLVVALLIITPLLSIAWWVGYSINDIDKYSLFIFAPEQSQKLKWYFHYPAYHIENIIKTFALFHFSKLTRSPHIILFCKIILIFTTIRLAEYCLFKGTIGILFVAIAVVVWLIIIYVQWQRN